jgi:predicted NUDIX family NTP pyrophosphohydrolase
MRVILEPVSGTAKESLERAKLEIERVLAFRGSVTSVKAQGTRIIVKFEINPRWDLTESEKVTYLMEWIPAKVKMVFKVHDVVIRENQRRKG